jgi:hypothetical protein
VVALLARLELKDEKISIKHEENNMLRLTIEKLSKELAKYKDLG